MNSKTLSKEKIIKAAIELINNQENLTFTKLSRKLGTRSQALYNYFPDIMAVKISVAISFYQDLAVRLKADLLGLSGKQAIMTFCNVGVEYALSKYRITQQVISLPAGQLHNQELEQNALEIQMIVLGLIKKIEIDPKRQLVLARMLVNLIIGEIVHVGNHRFNNKLISPRDSFEVMLKLILEGY